MSDLPHRPSILLIDDRKDLLEGLDQELRKKLSPDEVEIRQWQPVSGEDPEGKFNSLVDSETLFVATDHDLTRQGVTGLFGHTIVSWSQSRGIPVGDFSRGNPGALPKEPNLFELRVPCTEVEGAAFIASAFSGFKRIRQAIAAEPTLFASGSTLAVVLAKLLGRPHLDSQFALYLSRLAASSSSFLQRSDVGGQIDSPPDDKEKIQVMTYVLGHVLINSILKYPGPILTGQSLCAYIATAESELPVLITEFARAAYDGPFRELDCFFWREDVDSIIDQMAEQTEGTDVEDFGAFNREAVEKHLGRSLSNHGCDREGCGGRRGGFFCPFTVRPVCQRSDCSVSSSNLIPPGAQISRVERDFYNEWAPLLSL